MGVEFRLLGDLEARVDGQVVDIGHARQRSVLAVLLVGADRTAPVEQILDRVWSERLPQRARSALSGYVSRLRQLLAGADDVRITRQAGGYRLAVDPLAVDLHRFRHLITRARAAGDAEHALELFDEALGLWRGEAFAALDTPWLNGMRTALDAERLAAELDRNDLALRWGRHRELEGVLTDLALAHPLNERLAAQLMLAEYRGGRQADALHRYEQLRVRLADELGANPSPPLRRLHRQILTADPALEPDRR
jgi:DNA-binding SARP family transcriptional activator